jgi:DNA polymerase-3 subunit epsilon
MKYLFFYDTETTGFPLWKERSSDPRQPHIVQLAAKVINSETRAVVHALDVIIKPAGWKIPPDVSDIHGITTEHALRVGIPERAAVSMILLFSELADTRIAHNESFDSRIMRIALKRFNHLDMAIEFWKLAPIECTMRRSTNIVNLPPNPGKKTPKWPSLSEAYEFFTGKPLENAHNAMVDVDACIEVYFAMQDQEEVSQ